MQPGDVYCTWSDTRLLKELTGFKPNTLMELGVKNFVIGLKFTMLSGLLLL